MQRRDREGAHDVAAHRDIQQCAVGVPAETAELDPEGIEHHVSPVTLAAFERFLDHET
ncbi:hypothetical protein GCM10011326_18190 [Salipiger profundus]|nr:hypothetical protein GCM10011326_18190 [Salipiger profundus]